MLLSRARDGFLSTFFPNPTSDSSLVFRGTSCPVPANIMELRLLVIGHCVDVPPASPAQSSDLPDPRPQVWGTLIKADSLDEVLLTAWHHQPTVNQAEVVKHGHIEVGFPACAGRAAGIVLPGDALKVEEEAKGRGLDKRQEIEECPGQRGKNVLWKKAWANGMPSGQQCPSRRNADNMSAKGHLHTDLPATGCYSSLETGFPGSQLLRGSRGTPQRPR